MKILGWDSSSKQGCVSAFEWNEAKRQVVLRAEWSLSLDRGTNSEQLLWGIDQVLQSLHWRLPDVDGYAVGVGPGSFTGLRIGIATAKSFSMIETKKVLPMSSLEVMMEPLRPLPGTKAALLDACKGQWFYGIEHHGQYEEGIDVSDGVIARLQKLGVTDVIAVGDVFERYPKLLAASPVKFREAPMPFHQNLQGRSLASLAAKKLSNSPEWVDWQDLNPRYFRLSDAELKLGRSPT